MSSNTKIVVLRMKEIIYTAIFIGLGILLITLLFIMFRPGKKEVPAGSDQVLYIPGVYSSSLRLGTQEINVEVAVDANRITSVAVIPLSDSIAAMYPLIQPSLDNLAQQIYTNQSLAGVSFLEEHRYTSQALIQAIEKTLDKAAAK